MRSQVVRHVLRRPPAARGMATAARRPALRAYPVGCRFTRAAQRRPLFGFFQKPPRVLKALESEPGYETLLAYQAAENEKLRPPPIADLEAAWNQFFTYKERHNRMVNSTQVVCAHQVLEFFCRPNIPDDALSLENLHLAMRCLEKPPRDDTSEHLELSRALFRELRRRELNVGRFHNLTLDFRLENTRAQSKYVHSFLVALSLYGAALEARDIFLQMLRAPGAQTKSQLRASLLPVMTGLAKEGHEQALRELAEEAIASGIPYDVGLHSIMTGFFASRDNVEETKFWWKRTLYKGMHPSPRTYYEVLLFALRNDQQEWAMGVYKGLISRLEFGSLTEFKACWDVSFQYAFVLLGKGIDEIEHMFRVAMERMKDKPKSQPNIKSINSLLKCAIDKDDPYMAERFISLSNKMGFAPDLSTYILQMEYRLRAEDLSGAFATFQALRSLGTSDNDRELPVLNKLIRALCASPRPDYEQVLDVTSYLEQRHVTLEPETVVSICMAFLRNDELYEVIDTLSLHTAYYSFAERHMVRKSFVDYCLDKSNSMARVWDAYGILRQFFPELELEDRVAIMDAFFDRRRPDMACHVFGHMRAHANPRYRPTAETYVRCFEGIGQCPDEESLKTIHNMLKMDTTVQLNTLLYNALMIGYAACDAPHRALEYWKDITTSPEGPSYASLENVMRAYQVQPYGDEPAKELWMKMIKMELDIPENVYAAYVAMLAAHSHVQEVKELLDNHVDIIARQPDILTFAYAYNALPDDEMKEDFESWAQNDFPHIWKRLTEKHHRKKDMYGLLQFKVSRPWKA